jgi:hypothetical protein
MALGIFPMLLKQNKPGFFWCSLGKNIPGEKDQFFKPIS